MTRMIRAGLLAVALSFGAVGMAAAQDRAELALEAVDAGFLQQVQARLMETLWPRAETLIREKLPEVTDEKLAEFRTTAEQFARESAQYSLVPMGVALAKAFNEDELRQLIAFYSSPVGQKLNNSTGEITSVFAGEVTQRINEQIPAFQQRIEEMVAAAGGE